MNYDMIDSNLAGGSITAAPLLLAHGWEVVALIEPNPRLDGVGYVPLIDGGGNSPEQIQEAIETVVGWWAASKSVYVCCQHGMNRSVLIAAAALKVVNRVGWLADGIIKIARIRRVASPRDDTMIEVASVVRDANFFSIPEKG